MIGLVQINQSNPLPNQRAEVRRVMSYFISFNRITFETSNHYPYWNAKLVCNADLPGNSGIPHLGNQHIEKLVILPYENSFSPNSAEKKESLKADSGLSMDATSSGFEIGDDAISIQNRSSINLVFINHQ